MEVPKRQSLVPQLVEILRRNPADGAALALLCEMQVRTKLRIVPERLAARRVRGVGADRTDGREPQGR